MAWQILAMWAIVVATLLWFARDERRLRAEAAMVAAAAYYAHAPKYRFQASPAPALPAPSRRTGGLTDTQRRYLETLVQQSQTEPA